MTSIGRLGRLADNWSRLITVFAVHLYRLTSLAPVRASSIVVKLVVKGGYRLSYYLLKYNIWVGSSKSVSAPHCSGDMPRTKQSGEGMHELVMLIGNGD